MTRPEEPTEALPARAVPPPVDPGATVDLGRTQPPAEPTVYLAAAEPTVHLPGVEPAVHLAAAEPTVHFAAAEPTVHFAAAEPTVHLAGAEPTVHLAGAEPTVHLGAGEASTRSGGGDATVRPPDPDATVHLGGAPTPGATTGYPRAATGYPRAGAVGATAAGAYQEVTARAGTGPSQPVPGGEVRFGPGVPATPPAAPAWPAPARRSRWRAVVSVLSTLLTAALLVVVGLYVWQRLSPVEVEGVTVAVPQPAGDRCDVTVDVVATVRTNGRGGSIRYQWLRSDAPPGGLLTERVGRGQRSATLTLKWTFSGVGSTTETATVNIVEPSPVQAGTQVGYRCRRS
ncbi:hypothetical protein [Micromonospora narathiwatensis]|uniref:Uncharacterized protein n=1 Tax=Micromonospora narathiwatensis TaxID=299146 RepID=A0A1A8ZLZ8_9ACTN|nr:hypothetical protein [Micromonospora narathiwatensis]SBT44896.1 hypothetical protein GA0070621_2189 [Micromonospora narathiwatensis]